MVEKFAVLYVTVFAQARTSFFNLINIISINGNILNDRDLI